jgi:uncharacterized protein YjbJ (UPF0337 family)
VPVQHQKEFDMNKNQVKGAMNEAAGKVQKNVGDAIDSPSQEIKGTAREVKGKIQKNIGNAQEQAEDRTKDQQG